MHAHQWILVAAGLAFFGCVAPSRPCSTFADCSTGQTCVGGFCRGGTVGGGGGPGGGLGSGPGGGVGGGTGGNTGGGSGGGGGGGGDPFAEDSGIDAGVIPEYDGGCGPITPGNPPYPRRCAPGTTNECGPATDVFLTGAGVTSALLNGATGNGFDDDCDGLVDEGCTCSGNGTTKDCYLVPATQVNAATSQPVGWCTTNAKGSVDCAGGELSAWSGVCRGAQTPARFDSCAAGDFDCDGLSGNNQIAGCMCPTSVQCPTNTVLMAPYPPPNAIPSIDGSQWITDPAERAMTTNWTWTVLGGDCDNVLPFPTFALYSSAASSTSTRRGTRTAVKYDMGQGKYVPTAGEPLIALRANNYGSGTAGGKVHTAFGLSGDYLVQGEFTLGNKTYVCTQKVEVRAAGIRAELCWDTVGNNDVDLHFARLQGATCSAGSGNGWGGTCNGQDCYYASACAGGSDPGWSYTASPTTACQGWSSRRGTNACSNPRLDRDNVSCTRTEDDPTSGAFCGPENTNLDNPRNGDTFVIGANYFGGSSMAKPHVNVYCNGRRVLSVGYNPATGQTGFPLLRTSGGGASGDHWTVATVKANVTGTSLTSCDVTPIPSRHADTTRDGPVAMSGAGNNICVDSTMNQTPAPNTYSYPSGNRRFVSNPAQGVTIGSIPQTPTQWCRH
ncbi:MAG: hypothetical protein JNG84_12470 [Archangium sp.]|nr:hypothetical protein [Archangium sp.]